MENQFGQFSDSTAQGSRPLVSLEDMQFAAKTIRKCPDGGFSGDGGKDCDQTSLPLPKLTLVG